MSKYIDADLYVEMQIYDDEHEEWGIWNGTIEELLDQWTEQGSPLTIEISDKADRPFEYFEGYEDGRKSTEVSGDCISRECILGEAFASDEYNRETKSFDLPVVSVRDIEDAPSVVPSRAEGEWVKSGIYCKCSECGDLRIGSTDFYKKYIHFCDNCGAKMKG